MPDTYYPQLCFYCGRWSHEVVPRRMNTQYVNDEQNFLHSCSPCYERSEEDWAERWNDYYAGAL